MCVATPYHVVQIDMWLLHNQDWSGKWSRLLVDEICYVDVLSVESVLTHGAPHVPPSPAYSSPSMPPQTPLCLDAGPNICPTPWPHPQMHTCSIWHVLCANILRELGGLRSGGATLTTRRVDTQPFPRCSVAPLSVTWCMGRGSREEEKRDWPCQGRSELLVCNCDILLGALCVLLPWLFSKLVGQQAVSALALSIVIHHVCVWVCVIVSESMVVLYILLYCIDHSF